MDWMFLANIDISNSAIFKPEAIMVILGLAVATGFYFGELAKKIKLPSLIGFMFLGVLLGPVCLKIFKVAVLNNTIVENLSFITDLCLGFVAFSIGSELKLSNLKRLGNGIISIILAESFMAFFVVTGIIYLTTYLVNGAGDLPLALIFGAMAPASAPAGTVAVIQEYRAKGNLTNALYAVVGFDDGLAIIIFGFASALAKTLLEQEANISSGGIMSAMVTPCMEIFYSFGIGGIIGFIFCWLCSRLTNSREVFIVFFGAILIATGLSIKWHASLIMTNLIIGFLLVNTRREQVVQRVTNPLSNFMPLMFVMFFCLAGAHLELDKLPKLGIIGVAYIFGRSAGLIGGARLGAMFGKVDEKVKKYVGLGILSQAGVAIGLSLLVSKDFAEIGTKHANDIAINVITTITATCIFFEIVGPIMTKIALSKAGEIPETQE